MKTNRENMNYSLGLDIGTSSVGWAVIDQNGQLIKKGNKNLWGVRLFDSAQTAASRRISRSSRRRYNRRRMRIRLLQEIMNDMIMEVDDTFFIRLKDTTFLDKEDKSLLLKENYKDNYNLFIDSDYNDKDFFKQFPTIYHLRYHLIHSTEKEDPRLIYLALHHMIKYRGHFLYENQKLSLDVINIVDQFNDLLIQFCDKSQIKVDISLETQKQLLNILKEKTQRSIKVEECLNIINVNKENKIILKQFFSALVGLKYNVSKLFNNSLISKDISLNFSSDKYEDEINETESEIGDSIEIIEKMNSIYGWLELQGILDCQEGEELSISRSMINRYQKHHNDLKILKNVIKNNLPEYYEEVFKSKAKNVNNYYQYVHNPSKTTKEDFYKYLLKILSKCPSDNENVQYCIQEIKKENFLLKQNDRNNSNIPYQLHEDELNKILINQSKYYPTLKENFERIKKIFKFKIPYYVGPLDEKSPHAWIKRNNGTEDLKITPWNFDDIVDFDETAEKFITSMTNYCTYLLNEPVMPKNSLTANMYEVFSELNKITVNDKQINVDIKKKIINDLFMKYRVVKDKDLKAWLKKEQIYLNNEDLEIKGYQNKEAFSSSLRSWIDFKCIFDDIEENYELIENIIRDMTIFEDKKILRKRLKNIWHLKDEQIRYLLKKKYKGWSNLSRKLIDGIYADNRYGSHCTILDVMKETNKNLMQIINDRTLGFKQIIDEQTFQVHDNKFEYEGVARLHGSPAIKKGIWQSLKIVEEITHYMKHEPANIYIEFAREEGEKKRTISQIESLQNIYDDLNSQSKLDDEFNQEVYKNLKKLNKLNRLENERLYLYYTQMGKCMYSHENLDIDKLNLYEIDHVLPQSLIKDDSLSNKVLVIKKENQRKSDDPSLSNDIINKNEDYWKFLLDHKLITSNKYYNLMRREYDEKTIKKFINRQIVETRQITKNVAKMILEHYSSTKVMAIRANLIHQFREKYNIYKNRDVNDFHHAHDAYIGCIIGNFIQKCLPELEADYLYGHYRKIFNNMKNNHANNGFVLNCMDRNHIDDETGEVLWQKDCLTLVLRCFNYKDYYITKKLEDNDSSLFNVTIVPGNKNSQNNKTSASIAVNKSRADVEKYGGYSGLQYEILAIEGKKKKKSIRKLVGLPTAYKNYSNDDKIKYIEEKEKMTDVHIIRTIKRNQLIEYKNSLFYITSSNELVNAQQLIVNSKEMKSIDLIYKALSFNNYQDVTDDIINEVFYMWMNKLKIYYPLYEGIYNKIQSLTEQFNKLSIENKCKVIKELLLTTHGDATNGKIKIEGFNIGDRIGRLNNRTLLLDDFVLIESSVTGIYSKKVRL